MKKKRNWAPYLLILPSVLYLALFFVWPMSQALTLSVWDKDAVLELYQDADANSSISASLPRGAQITVLDRQGNVLNPEDLNQANLKTEIWFQVQGTDPDGQAVNGWAAESRVRVRESNAEGVALSGTIRRKLDTGADPLTSLQIDRTTICRASSSWT